jgi:hypothetical protein
VNAGAYLNVTCLTDLLANRSIATAETMRKVVLPTVCSSRRWALAHPDVETRSELQDSCRRKLRLLATETWHVCIKSEVKKCEHYRKSNSSYGA